MSSGTVSIVDRQFLRFYFLAFRDLLESVFKAIKRAFKSIHIAQQ